MSVKQEFLPLGREDGSMRWRKKRNKEEAEEVLSFDFIESHCWTNMHLIKLDRFEIIKRKHRCQNINSEVRREWSGLIGDNQLDEV